MTTLTFNDVNFHPVAQNDGQIWLTSSELAKALGYSNAKSIANLYNSNKDEFTSDMTTVIESVTVRKSEVIESVTSKNLKSKIRIFSLRGCHLMGFFAKTEIAKKFRIWVLNILDKEVGKPVIVPVNQLSTVDDRKPLVKAVNMLVDETGAIFSNVWKIVHQQFNVEKVEFLTKEQVPQAVKYIHELYVLAIQNANHVPKAQNIDSSTLNHIAVLVSHTFSVVNWYNYVKDPIKMLNPTLYAKSIEHIGATYQYARTLNNSLNLNVNEHLLLAR